MIDSRALYDLHESVAKRAVEFIAKCKREGIILLVTSTYRDPEKQNLLYAIGRRDVKDEKIVTQAKGGESYHNYRVALDVVPLVHGKPVWDHKNSVWLRIGQVGEACGLEWAGRWKGKFTELCHFQYTNGLTLKELKAGEKSNLRWTIDL